MKRKVLKWIFIGLAILINGFIIFNALLSAEGSASVSSPVVEIVSQVINYVSPGAVDANDPEFSNIVRKLIGHFLLTGVDGIVTSLAFYYSFDRNIMWKGLVCSLSVGVFISVGSELCQLLASGRSCEIQDMLIDFGGYLIATIITYGIVQLKKTLKGFKNEK